MDRFFKLSEFPDTPRDDGMERLILCPGDSAAGHLKRSRIANQVMALDRGDDFVWGPNPRASTPAAFFRAREVACDAGPATIWSWLRSGPAMATWNKVVAACERYERVELWSDPEPRSQLLILRTSAWFAQRAGLRPKLHGVHVGTRLGEGAPAGARHGDARARPLTPDDLDLATTLWDAFCAPTPEAWVAAREADLRSLPALPKAMRSLLAELPAPDSGLSATQTVILEALATGATTVARLRQRSIDRDPLCDDTAFDRALIDLARGDTPGLTGLAADLLDAGTLNTPERHRRYRQAELSMTDFARRVLAGEADFAAHNRVDRWWGGTHLRNDALWRWNPGSERLVPPR